LSGRARTPEPPPAPEHDQFADVGTVVLTPPDGFKVEQV